MSRAKRTRKGVNWVERDPGGLPIARLGRICHTQNRDREDLQRATLHGWAVWNMIRDEREPPASRPRRVYQTAQGLADQHDLGTTWQAFGSLPRLGELLLGTGRTTATLHLPSMKHIGWRKLVSMVKWLADLSHEARRRVSTCFKNWPNQVTPRTPLLAFPPCCCVPDGPSPSEPK